LTAYVHDIVACAKDNEMTLARRDDFVLGPPRAVSSAFLLSEPGWSPYCIDPAGSALVFVRLPPEIDLSTAAFLYVTQYRAAVQCAVLPLAELSPLVAACPDPRLILVFSMGRCGTTLVSHALNGDPSVCSLSEPDVFNQRDLRALPPGAGGSPLLRDRCRLLLAGRARQAAGTLAVKFRSQALFIADRFWSELPDARYVFMYREALGWAQSFLQFLSDVGMTIPFDGRTRDLVWSIISADTPLAVLGRYVDLGQLPLHPDRLLAAAWARHLQKYEEERAAGVPFLAIRYDELVEDRLAGVTRLFRHCGLPLDGIANALGAFDEDSQKDTIIGRRNDKLRFTPDNVAAFRETLARTVFPDPGLILPDVYSGERAASAE
jgi:hypothetical protein